MYFAQFAFRSVASLRAILEAESMFLLASNSWIVASFSKSACCISASCNEKVDYHPPACQLYHIEIIFPALQWMFEAEWGFGSCGNYITTLITAIEDIGVGIDKYDDYQCNKTQEQSNCRHFWILLCYLMGLHS